MCLEVYHPIQPVLIPYENEIIRFDNPNKFTAYYKFLLTNEGNLPIDRINILYPRSLYTKSAKSGAWYLKGISNRLGELPSLLSGSEMRGKEQLRLVQPDPNRPQFDREPLDGQFLLNDAKISVPNTILKQGIELLHQIGATFFQIQFQTPLEPRESRWFCYRIEVEEAGMLVESPIGKIAIHQLSSPVDVRRTVEEKIEAGVRRAQMELNTQWLVKLAKTVQSELGFHTQRMCDIQYYELVLNLGESKNRFLLNWEVERDLRMRSNSPREVDGELLYEWKSGSLLRPDGYPWKNEGFILHLKFVTN